MGLITRLGVVIILALSSLVVFPLEPLARATATSVSMADFAFVPATLTVQVGDTVTWTNTDTAPHDVTTTSGPYPIHSTTLSTGQSWSYTFTTPGTYAYICSIHPDMHASITVNAAPAVPAAAPPQNQAATAAAESTTAGKVTASRGVAAPAASTPIASTPTASTFPTPTQTPTASAASAALPATTPSNTPQPPSSAPPVLSQAASTPAASPLKPLLLLAGLIAAIATFCLLMLASRPDEPLKP